MIEVESKTDIERAILSNKVVIIEYYKENDSRNKEFSRAVKYLERHVDPSILVLRVCIDKNPELSKDIKDTPALRVYLDGKLVFEQYGSFGKSDLDLYVLRRSIRHVLRSFNISLKV